MIYNISSISNYLSILHRSRTEDNRPYICRKYRIQPYSKGVREELRFRQRLLIKENLRVERELKEFEIRWLDDVRRDNEMFEAGEDDSLFPTKQYPESGKKRGFDTSRPLWGIDYLLRNGENCEGKTANGK
jgi:hypothetical protein